MRRSADLTEPLAGDEAVCGGGGDDGAPQAAAQRPAQPEVGVEAEHAARAAPAQLQPHRQVQHGAHQAWGRTIASQ